MHFLHLGYGEIGLSNLLNASIKLTLMWLLINIAVKNKYGIINLLVHLLLSSCVRPWPAALMKYRDEKEMKMSPLSLSFTSPTISTKVVCRTSYG